LGFVDFSKSKRHSKKPTKNLVQGDSLKKKKKARDKVKGRI
jgi:hypothetical protein